MQTHDPCPERAADVYGERRAPRPIYRASAKEALIMLWKADGIAEARLNLYAVAGSQGATWAFTAGGTALNPAAKDECIYD